MRVLSSVLMRPARRSVMRPDGVDGAEVAARRNVRGLEVEVDAHRLEHAAADVVHQRVVAEERKVAGAAAQA